LKLTATYHWKDNNLPKIVEIEVIYLELNKKHQFFLKQNIASAQCSLYHTVKLTVNNLVK